MRGSASLGPNATMLELLEVSHAAAVTFLSACSAGDLQVEYRMFFKLRILCSESDDSQISTVLGDLSKFQFTCKNKKFKLNVQSQANRT